MFNALLLAVVQLVETAVNYSFGTVLIAAGVVGAINASRCMLTDTGDNHMSAGSLSLGRKGTQSVTLAAVMVAALGCVAGGVMFWMR